MRKTKHYLKAMLPKPYYKKITDIKALEKHFLCRLSPEDNVIIKKSGNYEKLFNSEDLSKGLSVNLLSVFNHNFAQFRMLGKVKDEHFKPWEPNQDPVLPKKIQFRKKANFIGVKISELNNIPTFKINITFIKTAEDNKSFSRVDDSYVKAVHTPVKGNFWHFEIQLWCRSEAQSDYYIKEHPRISNKGKRRYSELIAEELYPSLIVKFRHSSECKCLPIPHKLYISRH